MGNLIFFFLQQVEEAFAFWGTPEGDLVHPAAVLEADRRHRVNVDGNVCTVMVTTLVLEGWQRKLDPRFHEGLLSSEQGAYIAESIAAKNMKQAKSRFRIYEDATDHGGSNHSAKVEPDSGCTGERETGKSAKKLDKGRTAKEEASKREKYSRAAILFKYYSNEHEACTRSGRNFLSQSLLRPPGSAPKKDLTCLGARLATT
ncbi:unnamed protein product [Prunus armeniaca]